MRPLLLSLLIILAIPFYTGNDELPKVKVIDKNGEVYEGRYVRTWDGVNILYDSKWKQVYQMERY